MSETYIPKGRPVPDSHQYWALKLTHRVGPVAAARLIGIGRGTLAAVCAGLPVYYETELAIRRARNSMEAEAA